MPSCIHLFHLLLATTSKIGASKVAGADAPAAEACSDGSEALPSEWRDEGVFWAAPALWYSTWLREIWPALERCAEIGPRSARDRPEISAPRAAQSGSHPLH